MTEWDGRERFSRVIEYIESNLFGELTLESVAASACLSVYHFHRMFQALFGDPVMEYIRNRRLDAGASLLTETDEKILEIALRCRFESHEAFIRAFRRRYGMTPGAFRKRAPVFARYPAAALKTRLDGADRPAGLDEPYLERRDEFEVAGIEGEVRFYGYRVAVEAIRLWRTVLQGTPRSLRHRPRPAVRYRPVRGRGPARGRRQLSVHGLRRSDSGPHAPGRLLGQDDSGSAVRGFPVRGSGENRARCPRMDLPLMASGFRL